jgi:hypothetical protein
MAETPRFLLASGQHDEFHAAGHAVPGAAAANTIPTRRVSFAESFARLAARRDLLARVIGASAAWFLMDFT